MPLRLSAHQWRMVVRWFVRGLPSARIAVETGLERKRVLRALAIVREAMLRSTPETGVVEPRPASPADKPLKPRAAALGLYATEHGVGVQVLPEAVAESVRRVLRTRRLNDLSTFPPLDPYAALVFRNRLYRLKWRGDGAPAFGQIEAFWSFLQRQLRARGGIRGGRLALHLAEFTWRYNRRRLAPQEQVREILRLVRQNRWRKED